MASAMPLPAGVVDSILAAFQEFDKENSGYIQRADLKTVLQTIDKDMWNDEAVDSLFAAVSPRSAGDSDGDVPYRDFVASVFASAAGDSNPLSLEIPKKTGKSAAANGALRDQLSSLNARLMRLTSGAGKNKAESVASLAARIEEHAANGGDSRALPKTSGSRTASAASYVSEAFACYDVDNSGYLDINELSALAKELGVTMDKSEVARLFKAIDTAGNNQISLPEFCAFMSASEVTGSISQSLRMKLWNRKFDRAAKSLRDTMERQGDKGKTKVKSEDDEPGELVLQIGDDIGEPALRLKVVGTFDERSSEIPLTEIATTLKLRLAPPGGLQDQAAQMHEFLQELVDGPPPGWESASIKKVEGSDEVEVTLDVKLPVPPMLAQVPKLPGNGESAGRYEIDVCAALNLQKLAQATEESPYDVTADTRLSARVSASFMNDSVLDSLYALGPMAPDPDEPEEEWRSEARIAKYVLPAYARWLLKARGTVNLADLAPVLRAFCDCRGFGDSFGERTRHEDTSLDKLFPDLRKATAASVRMALLQALDAADALRLRNFKNMSAGPGQWQYWSAILSARTILTCIGFVTGATIETVTPYGTSKVAADLSGLSGLNSFVPSFQELKREATARDEIREAREAEFEARRAEAEKNRPHVGDRVCIIIQGHANLGRTATIIHDDMDGEPFTLRYEDTEEEDRYFTMFQLQKLEGGSAPEADLEADQGGGVVSPGMAVIEADQGGGA